MKLGVLKIIEIAQRKYENKKRKGKKRTEKNRRYYSDFDTDTLRHDADDRELSIKNGLFVILYL